MHTPGSQKEVVYPKAMPCSLLVHFHLWFGTLDLLPRFELVACYPEMGSTDGYLHTMRVAGEISRGQHNTASVDGAMFIKSCLPVRSWL